eukprot:7824853-Pyramimonas_sp.AAC.1
MSMRPAIHQAQWTKEISNWFPCVRYGREVLNYEWNPRVSVDSGDLRDGLALLKERQFDCPGHHQR